MAAAGKEIIYTNVGNPQQLGEKPITFNRQVQALVSCPSLIDDPKAVELFPEDVVARAKQCLCAAQRGARRLHRLPWVHGHPQGGRRVHREEGRGAGRTRKTSS